jgi:hypothetical protein
VCTDACCGNTVGAYRQDAQKKKFAILSVLNVSGRHHFRKKQFFKREIPFVWISGKMSAFNPHELTVPRHFVQEP